MVREKILVDACGAVLFGEPERYGEGAPAHIIEVRDCDVVTNAVKPGACDTNRRLPVDSNLTAIGREVRAVAQEGDVDLGLWKLVATRLHRGKKLLGGGEEAMHFCQSQRIRGNNEARHCPKKVTVGIQICAAPDHDILRQVERSQNGVQPSRVVVREIRECHIC